MIRKVAVIFGFLIAMSAFGQEFTFNGLPWGASREQVIAEFGIPATNFNDMLSYSVSLMGRYTARLDIIFDSRGMIYASYNVGWYRDLNVSQLSNARIALINQITDKYGAYTELIVTYNINGIQEEVFTVWNFNNFHILISHIDDNNTFHIGYLSDTAWGNIENTINTGRFLRLTNRGL